MSSCSALPNAIDAVASRLDRGNVGGPVAVGEMELILRCMYSLKVFTGHSVQAISGKEIIR
jgi:hypothetical protein